MSDEDRDRDREEDRELDTIGPYQVLGSIGRGGMGEVLLARDPRLGRKVAIKRIRADGNADARQRFQREARLAAALSHPSIVPVFDLVVLGQHEHLVMELVEGPSLTQWLEERHSLEQKLLIAEQIAAGLAHAHRQGIVHRDLKTENVLLSSEQQAKIADFGIARRDARMLSAALAENIETGTELHTREGTLLGTYRSMAPEQARGEGADARSDLFSFGVLLFEMFAGGSPFRGPSPLETLYRLTSLPHPVITDLVPGLPPGLVRLIDRLLEKDPELRPRSAQEVLQQIAALRRDLEAGQDETVVEKRPSLVPPASAAPPGRPRRWRPWMALLAAPLVGAFWLWGPRPGATAAAEPLYAAVVAPRWEGPDSAAAGEENQQLGFTVRTAVLRQLSALQGVSPKSFDEVDQVAAAGDPAGQQQVAEATGADEVVVPTISCSGGDCRLRLERWQAGDRRVTAVADAELPPDDAPLAARAVQDATRRLYPELPPRRPGETPAFPAGAFTRLLAIRQQLARQPDSRLIDRWLDELRELREKNPAFFELAVLEVEVAWRGFAETRQEGLRERARASMSAALALAPEDPEVLLRAAWLAILDERPQEAETFLAAADRVAPGDLRVVDYRALLRERGGELEKALELRRRAAQRRPSWSRSYNLAFALYRLSRWQEACAVLDALLAKAPQHGRALSLRARTELTAGDPRQAAVRFEALLARSENLLDRYNLATAYLLMGDGAGSARESEKLLAAAPGNPIFQLALAEARSLEGRQEEAAKLYRQVAVALENEEDQQSLGVRAQAHARLGEKEKAIELLQQTLQKAPGYDGQVAFEAALVYTLAGDRTAALVNIRKTIAQGWGGWLRLPPFAVWRGDPEIAPLLEQAVGELPLSPAAGRDKRSGR